MSADRSVAGSECRSDKEPQQEKEKYERHPRHGAALAVCLENLDDNDTSAGEHGSRSGVRGMLQQEREM